MKIGLSLSGGGAKGLYHLGYLQYLKENGITFDVISGTSAGSLAGTMFALGYEPVNLKDKVKTMKSRSFTSILKSISGSGLVGADAMKDLIEGHILENTELNQTFSDLDIDLNILATDLVSGEEVLFNKVNTPNIKIMDAMLASSSYPMVFAPVEVDGGFYSDGGIMNHFPADITSPKVNYNLGIFITPKSRAKRSSLKSARSIALRAMSLQGYASEIKKFKLCNDIVFQQELADYKTFDVSEGSVEEMYQMGYRDAKANPELILKLKKLVRYREFLKK